MTNENKAYGIIPNVEKLSILVNDLKDKVAGDKKYDDFADNITQIEELIHRMTENVDKIPSNLHESYSLIVNVIDTLKDSRVKLRKSVTGLIKKAGLQLQKVTSTTQEATNKIMDTAEKLDEQQDDIIELIEELNCTADKDIKIIAQIKEKVEDNQESAFQIIDFLQFQDITAQQIAGIYSMLSDTERTLIYVAQVLKRFDMDIDDDIKPSMTIDKETFNKDASFSDKKVVQKAIDDLFTDGKVDDEAFEESENKEKEDFSQNDIDSLVQANSKKEEKTTEKTSQDDIDKLFE